MGPSIGTRVWVRRRLARVDLPCAHAYNLRVAKLEPTVAAEEEAPPLDPQAVERAYRLHRARRAARQRWQRERRWAGLRFWLVLVLVLAAAVLLAAWTLDEIERLFGL
jgi:anti-sigma-K factor RskA